MIRAAVVEICGQPPSVVSRQVPLAAAGQSLVTVAAAPITPLDLLCASGTSYFGQPTTPYVPGVQGVGHRPDGTPVWFATSAGMRPGDGSMAGALAVPEKDLVDLPAGVPLAGLAALGLSAVAAHLALTGTGRLTEGEQVVVLGAGGIVGQSAIQLALLAGPRRGIAVARSAQASVRALELGSSAAVTFSAEKDRSFLAHPHGERHRTPRGIRSPNPGVPGAPAGAPLPGASLPRGGRFWSTWGGIGGGSYQANL